MEKWREHVRCDGRIAHKLWVRGLQESESQGLLHDSWDGAWLLATSPPAHSLNEAFQGTTFWEGALESK